MRVKTVLVCKTSKSTIEGVFVLFTPQYKTYMQEILDQHVQIDFIARETNVSFFFFLCFFEVLHIFGWGVSIYITYLCQVSENEGIMAPSIGPYKTQSQHLIRVYYA